MANMVSFMIRRLLAMIVVVYLIATMVFLLVHLSPIDPVVNMAGVHVTPSSIRALKHAFGLDVPVHQQYLNYVGGLAHGQLGLSYEQGYFQQPVWNILKVGLPVSLKLGGLSLLVALLISMPIGLISAINQNSWIDHTSQTVIMVLYALPAFVVAPIAQIVLGANLHVLPVSGWGDPGIQGIKEMIMPVGVFSTQIAGYFAKSFRSFMLEVLSQDYIRTARAKGLRESLIIYRHAVKNTLLPLASIVGPSIAFLVVGAFIIEFYFGIPGIGSITINSVIAGDFPVIEATTILIASAVVVVNGLTDIFYALVDPRVRL